MTRIAFKSSISHHARKICGDNFLFIIIMNTHQTLIYTSHLNKQKHEYLKEHFLSNFLDRIRIDLSSQTGGSLYDEHEAVKTLILVTDEITSTKNK